MDPERYLVPNTALSIIETMRGGGTVAEAMGAQATWASTIGVGKDPSLSAVEAWWHRDLEGVFSRPRETDSVEKG